MTITNNSATFTASFSIPNPVGGGLISPSSTPYSGTLCPGGCLGGGENFGGRFLLNSKLGSVTFVDGQSKRIISSVQTVDTKQILAALREAVDSPRG